MHYFSSKDLSAKGHYKLLTGAVIPRPVAFVTTASTENQTVNAAPFSYFSVISAEPPVVSVSVQRKDGKMKDTARNAITNRELVIHISTESLVEELNKTAATLEPENSELTLTSLHTTPSSLITVPGIKEAVIRFECKLQQHVEIKNDEGAVTADVLLAQVLCYHVSDTVYDESTGYLDANAIAPISRLAGNDYAKLGKIFTIERPK